MRAMFTGALTLLGALVPAVAQFATPVVDGSIATNEYGIHSDGANQNSNGSRTWYMTWDSNNLYVAISGAATSEGAVVYLDVNPIAPINGGTTVNGTIIGQAYDNTNFASLPFRADRVLYVKDGYREIRNAAGGTWSAAVTSIGAYASSGAVREFSIPWSLIGGRPAAFAWFGYVTTAGGSVYGAMPMENAEVLIGMAARYERYYTINGTEDGNSTWPFARNSFVFNGTSDWVDAGLMNVYDFTMNSPGRTITRSANTATWTMSGNLHIEAGTISFGNSYGTASIDCDVIVGQAGALVLSNNTGGDLIVQRNLQLSGAFTHNGRRVTLAGPLNQSLITTATFADLTVSKSGGTVTMLQDARILGTLTLVAGHVRLANNASVIIGGSGNITGASAAAHIKTLGAGSLKREGVGNAVTSFPVGTDASYNPVTIANAGTPDMFSVKVSATFDPPAPGDLRRVVNRQWTITEGVIGGSNAVLTFQWNPAEHGTLFNPSNPVSALQGIGAQWTEMAASVSGNGPFTARVSGIAQFNRFGIGNSGATDAAEDRGAPKEFALFHNYPNPFNPTTEIRYQTSEVSPVVLQVYDLLGREVAVMVNAVKVAGEHSVEFDARNLPSGVYYYRLSAGKLTQTRKMILAK